MKKDYDLFIRDIKDMIGIDLTMYKKDDIKRRLENLKSDLGYGTFPEFLTEIKDDKNIERLFLDKLTVNVTEFFRNFTRWEHLEKKIIPQLLTKNKSLKVWSAACSSGEESYTLGMILSKYLPQHHISILATDIDETVLEKAKRGVFAKRSLKQLPIELGKKFFSKVDEGYAISDDIKNMITFEKHDLLKGNFDTNFDLIVCRNVLIYFTEEAKCATYHRLSEALCTGGYLFVGSTEQIVQPSTYNLQQESSFIYQKL